MGGQIGTAVCKRQDKRLKKYYILRENVIAIPDRMGGEFDRIAKKYPKSESQKVKSASQPTIYNSG